ncbi:MAG: acyl-CoA thioesterase [Gammaproteobacteria bacterium]|nr:MAG: acyl-CoA thioesterase [Gammaproteobacteria bacterium]
MMETYRGVVKASQVDHMGHMSVQWYAAKFEDATWQFFAALGITPAYIRKEKMGMAALEQSIQYHAEVHAGDVLLVRSRALSCTDKVFKFVHEMVDALNGKAVATTQIVAVHFDLDKRRACVFPDTIKNQIQGLLDRQS